MVRCFDALPVPRYAGRRGRAALRAAIPPAAAAALLSLLLAGCNTSVYTRDGVTDGDTFHLAPAAMADSGPVRQSWVVYSLGRAACQLEAGGPNPARVSTYGCELTARRLLAENWLDAQALDPDLADTYLDALSAVYTAGFLDEYVVRYHGRKDWEIPAGLDEDGFADWRRRHLHRHAPETHITGWWSYSDRQ